MDENTPGYFPETLQKGILRTRGYSLIEQLCIRKSRQLSYCGMCGIEAIDIVSWRPSLRSITVIERPIRDEGERIHFKTKLLLKLTPFFNGNIAIFFQDIWEFLQSAEFQQLAVFPDVINLDFCGGMMHQIAMEYPKQRDAFQRIFELGSQRVEDFILLVTLMPRDKGKATYKQYLGDHMKRLASSVPTVSKDRIAKQVESNRKFHEKNNLHLFKACLPILLEDIGKSRNYRVKTSYVRLYTKMIHFAFECSFVPRVLGLPFDLDATVRVLNQPIRKLLANGQEDQQWPPQIKLA